MYTAAKSKCDVFFTPDGSEESYEHQNYLDAASVINDANENSRNLTDQAKQKSKEDIKSAKDALLNEAENSERDLKIEELADVIYSKVLEM